MEGLSPDEQGVTLYDVFNTKEDQEVLNGLFNGRLAHKQRHDVHTIKAVKFWDMV